MGDAMVTGRMGAEKKERASRILRREGLGASQAINLLYDRVIEEGGASFLVCTPPSFDPARLAAATAFVDALTEKRETRFDDMTRAQIKHERLAARGLV